MFIFNIFNNNTKSTKEPKEYDVENQYIKYRYEIYLIIKQVLTDIKIDELLGNFEKQL